MHRKASSVFFTGFVLVLLCSCSGVEADPESRDPDSRRLGTLELGSRSDAVTVRKLVMFLDDPDDLVREAALIALNRIGRKEFSQHVKGKLHDPGVLVRSTAARVLADLDGKDSLSVLVPLCQTEADAGVRAIMVEQVGRFPEEPQAQEALVQAIGDKDLRVSATSYDILERHTGQKDFGMNRDRWQEWLRKKNGR